MFTQSVSMLMLRVSMAPSGPTRFRLVGPLVADSFSQQTVMWRSLLLGKLAISIAVSLLVGGYSIWSLQNRDYSEGEYTSWLSVGVFFLVLATVQIVMIVFMFRKKKFD